MHSGLDVYRLVVFCRCHWIIYDTKKTNGLLMDFLRRGPHLESCVLGLEAGFWYSLLYITEHGFLEFAHVLESEFVVRSEERRVGTEGLRRCRDRGS